MVRMELDKRSEAKFKAIMDRKAKALSTRKAKQDAAMEGLKPAEEKAKSLVAVDTGALRDSIERRRTDEGAILATDKEYATSSEYLDRPFMRPAAKATGEIFGAAGKVFKNIAEKA